MGAGVLTRGTSPYEKGLSREPHRIAERADPPSMLDRLGVAGRITAAAREVAIGQRVELAIAPPSGDTVEDVRWEPPPGTVVRDYEVVRRVSARVLRLAGADLARSPLAFHWVDGGDGREVKARALLEHVDRVTGDGTILSTQRVVEYVFPFDVKAPVIERFTATAAKTPEVYDATKRLWVLGYSRRKGRLPGIEWHWKVTLPERHGGLIKDVQAVWLDRMHVNQAPGSDESETLRSLHPDVAAGRRRRHWQLDQDHRDDLSGSDVDAGRELTEVTYSSQGYYGHQVNFPKRVAGGESVTDDQTWDSPRTTLGPLGARVVVDDRFKYFIMYRPDGDRAIWVPVGRAEWFWRGEGFRRGTRHVLKSGRGGISRPGGRSTEFPAYETNVNDNEFVTVP